MWFCSEGSAEGRGQRAKKAQGRLIGVKLAYPTTRIIAGAMRIASGPQPSALGPRTSGKGVTP